MKNEVVRGQTVIIIGTVYRDEDNTIADDITGANITVMFKDNPKKPDSSALFSKTVGSGVTISNAEGGVYQCIIDAEDIDLSNRILYFETVVQLIDNQVRRSGVDMLYINENVKHE